MVAVIKTGTFLHRAFNYNEQKVKEGIATCIAAVNYPKDVAQLTLSNKLNRLLHQAALNENVTRKSVHISLNFDPSETYFSPARLTQIAHAYMDKIGFGDQPYLVYQHRDAGHPHIHIVTTKVKADASRIDMQNIGRNQSEKARKEIEKAFGLVQADAQKKKEAYELKPVHAQKVQYGKRETKRAIANVIEHVLNSYKFASLPELNAVLRLYNVIADRGDESSRIYKTGGLVYRVVDANGKKTGVPIKASDFYNKPTLKFLQERFVQHEEARLPYKARIKNAVDLALLKHPKHSVHSLIESLKREGIDTVIRQNEAGLIYGLTYVDHYNKCVFNGSDLGKAYSARGLKNRCLPQWQTDPNALSQQSKIRQSGIIKEGTQLGLQSIKDHAGHQSGPNALEALLQPTEEPYYMPSQLINHKKKKRKRQSKNL